MLPAYSLRPRAAKPPGTLQLFPAGMCNATPSQAKDLKGFRNPPQRQHEAFCFS